MLTLISLGSNRGDREQTLDRAVESIATLPQTQLIRKSDWIDSTPVGGPQQQDRFLNGAVLIDTLLEPEELADKLHSIEADFGRERVTRWGPRTLDLDLLLYEQRIIRSRELCVPHPRMTFRPFVMHPATAIAGDLKHPELGATLNEIQATLHGGSSRVRVAGEDMHRREACELLLDTSRRIALLEQSDQESWLGVDLSPDEACEASPPRTARLQVLSDGSAEPLTATPTLWLGESPAEQHADEIRAAIACVWPDLG